MEKMFPWSLNTEMIKNYHMIQQFKAYVYSERN